MRLKLNLTQWLIAISSIFAFGLSAQNCYLDDECCDYGYENYGCGYENGCECGDGNYDVYGYGYGRGCSNCGCCNWDSVDECWGCCNPCGRPNNCNPDSQRAWDLGLRGVWMPQDPPLFRHFMADPRQPTYSVAWRWNDNALTKNVIPVSYFSTFPIYRWFNVGPCRGMLQIELEGCLWAVFDPSAFSAPLLNADYYVGVPLTYSFCNWSFRLRGYHVSSHIGDEFLLNHPGFDRKNPSAETLDFSVSYRLTREIRVYGLIGAVVHCDESFPCKRFLADCGLELRMYRLGFHDRLRDVFGHPIFGMHFRYKPDFKNHIDATYILGYEFGRCWGSRQLLRAFIEYHDGYSVEGQFSRRPTSYFAVKITYGY